MTKISIPIYSDSSFPHKSRLKQVDKDIDKILYNLQRKTIKKYIQKDFSSNQPLRDDAKKLIKALQHD